MKFFTAVLILFSTTVFATDSTIESKRDLGHGFQFIVIAKDSQSSFESVGHFEYLYFKKKEISQCSEASVRNDGKIAIYQDGPSGNIFVYHTTTNTSMQLTPKFPGLASGFQWLSPNQVKVEIAGHNPLVLSIPKEAE